MKSTIKGILALALALTATACDYWAALGPGGETQATDELCTFSVEKNCPELEP